MEIINQNRNLDSSKLPIVSHYLDFRDYLRDYYLHQKQTQRNYTYAVFSARADIKSPNYLKLVIDGKRNLSDSMIPKFAKALALTKEETEDFRYLVRYSQAKDGDTRNFHLRELHDLRVKHQLDRGEINKDIWEKIPGWISWVIYEMVAQRGMNFTAKEIQRKLRPKVSIDEIEAAIQRLVDLGEISIDEETGEAKKLRDVIKTPEEIPVALVKKIQAEFINLAMESLFNDSPKDREFGALTLCMNRDEFERLKFDLRKLRKKYHRDTAVARSTEGGERVYQFNVQLFSITDPVLDN
ncbi:MAG: TIGR02147 family protein [Bdellovibrionota bacterium]|nr:TIGR02147 family protein [Pseudobdellovibrionaceae bacterium]|tara:strand:+ start:133911 stop:134801 length:891 start_codon:yes stop_codon:yes gene_type:complete